MFRNKSIDVHRFSMVPRAEIPRSAFMRQTTHKTTMDSGYLVPVFVDEVLPGDTFKLDMTLFCRMATPLFPVMDNLHLDSFFFFVPTRLLWSNWKKFMGEQDSPADSISYAVPQVVSPAGGFAVGTVYDYMGLPTVGQVGAGNTVSVNSLPLRAYRLIFHEWFRDENVQTSTRPASGDGPDNNNDYFLFRRGKRHDYFTSALPWPQKGSTAVSLPLGTSAPVVTTNAAVQLRGVAENTDRNWNVQASGTPTVGQYTLLGGYAGGLENVKFGSTTGLQADLSTATAATINQLRQAFQIQKLLERDARGGTRYTEIVRAHFGVTSPDARLQRPEYLGGGSTVINITPVAQTAQTGLTGGATPMGTLAAVGTGLAHGHGFTQSFTEHGYILGLVSVRADLTYQQGLRKMWSRSTRYDFYFPAFAMLGEQAILNREIYCDGSANDAAVFGYQERWAELRHFPAMITGKFRSTAAGTLDAWHLAQKFTALPTLNATFIQETPPVSRVVAVPSEPQFLLDTFFNIRTVRPMPMFSVPGLIDHF